MAKPRAILKRVHAVKNIAKITNTMQLIATARFKTAFDRAVAARPYTDRLGRLLAELRDAVGESFDHPLLATREAKKVVMLAVASNRGLCGGYNSGVARELARYRRELLARGLEVELVVSGKKLASMLRFQDIPVTKLITHIDDRPTFAQVDEIISPLLDRFQAGEVDEAHVVYTKFVSSSRQRPTAERVLPLEAPVAEVDEDAEEGEAPALPTPPPSGREYLFSPDPETILGSLLPRRIRLHVFQAFLDAAVSEQTARMMAMKAATDNAYDMIGDLTRVYNRSRQSQITTELNEIMGGAAALE